MFYQNQHYGISEYFHKESGENFSFPAHLHHSFEFIAVHEGEMSVNIGDAQYMLTAGEGVLIFPEEIHSLTSERSRHSLVIFSPDLIKSYYSRHPSEVLRNSMIQLPCYLLDELSTIDESASPIKIKAVLYSLCALFDDAEYEKKIGAEAGLLHSIFDFLENNYNKKCTLATLGKELGYNASYLSRYFSEVTGIPFTAYANRHRISKACYLLRTTDKTILECACDCGYTSLRSFNRNFKEIIGLTPKEYRTVGISRQ